MPHLCKKHTQQPLESPALEAPLTPFSPTHTQSISESCGLSFKNNPETDYSSQLFGLTLVQLRQGTWGIYIPHYGGPPPHAHFPAHRPASMGRGALAARESPQERMECWRLKVVRVRG